MRCSSSRTRRGLPERCCSVAVSVLLQALIDRACQLPRLYEPQGADGRIMSVLLDELVAAPLEQLHLPRPSDPRLLKLTDAMLADPADSASLPQWAARIGMSERSMSRLFRQQTGMSVGRWRRQWHVIAGLQRLTSGLSVQTVAYELGYDSASAFVTMFKKAVGKPPGRFLAERTGAASEPELPVFRDAACEASGKPARAYTNFKSSGATPGNTWASRARSSPYRRENRPANTERYSLSTG